MKVLKLFVIAFFASVLVTPLVLTRAVKSQSGPTDAPAAFDNQTNGFEPQGTPVPPGTTNVTPGNFEADKFLFSKVDEVADGLGPVYNAQSCRECHQNPVTGGISQISELRAGRSRPDGTFVDAPGGSLINDRAIDPKIQERVPDGARIVFQNGSQKVGVMGFDGGQIGAVANTPVVGDYPSFSPDGTKIAFHSAPNAWVTPNPSNIWIMNSDGTNLHQLTTSNGDFTPVYSPDGTKIAFTSNRTGQFQVWVMNADGTNQVNISSSSTVDALPSWSPDGTKIAFERGPINSVWKIWKMNPDGSAQTQVTSDPGNEERPTWSPDGTMIAFSSNVNGNKDIYKVLAAGGPSVRLTTSTAADTDPAWAPDNSAIAFVSNAGGTANIWAVAPDGANLTQLTTTGGGQPAYSKDQGETIRTFRASLNLLGDGFVECITDAKLLEIRDLQPAEMRGTALSVPLLEAPGQTRVGRFGWKDQLASLLSFSSDAYLNEMGITNRFNLIENTSLGRSVAAFDTVADNQPCDSDGANCGEDPEEDIQAFTRFMRSTKAPPRDRDLAPSDDTDPNSPNYNPGSALFDSLSCSVCHVRSIPTAPAGTVINGGTFTVPAALGDKVIHPFGDFLLHDIGTGDGIAQAGGEATKNMVRTAPLWGVRTRTRLMHDAGGSSSPPTNSGAQSFILNEAILRHAGQATSSRNAYQALTPLRKAQLIRFLKSL